MGDHDQRRNEGERNRFNDYTSRSYSPADHERLHLREVTSLKNHEERYRENEDG